MVMDLADWFGQIAVSIGARVLHADVQILPALVVLAPDEFGYVLASTTNVMITAPVDTSVIVEVSAHDWLSSTVARYPGMGTKRPRGRGRPPRYARRRRRPGSRRGRTWSR